LGKKWTSRESVSFHIFFPASLRPNTLSKMVGEYMQAAGVGTHGACHLFRHAMATAMLENGADVRIVQAMLGHANLQTTAIYAHVAVAKLKKSHDATHRAGNNTRYGTPSVTSCRNRASVRRRHVAGGASDWVGLVLVSPRARG
jgi:integrase